MDIQKELVAEYESETAKSRKMLEALPADVDFTWKPHAKSMTLGRLVTHLAETAGNWALHTLVKDKMEWTPADKPNPAPHIDKAALLAQFDKQVAEVKAALAKLPLEKWDANWKFVAGDQVWIDDSKYSVWRNWVINHLIHHRAQVGVYLRILGHPIPGCYGPSADEM